MVFGFQADDFRFDLRHYIGIVPDPDETQPLVSIDDQCGGVCGESEFIEQFGFVIQEDGVSEFQVFYDVFGIGNIFRVGANGGRGHIFPSRLPGEGLQFDHFGFARAAPGGPEEQHHDLIVMLVKVEPFVGECAQPEIGDGIADTRCVVVFAAAGYR